MKAQAQLIREVLTFSIGIFIVSTCILTFRDYISNIVVGSLTYSYLESLAVHFEFLLNDAYSIANKFTNSSLTYYAEMPTTVLGSSYELYVRDSKVCARLFVPEREWCKNSSLPSNLRVVGSFFSSRMMILKTTKNLTTGEVKVEVFSEAI